MDTNGNTKKLLIKDLCARLPYDVKVLYDNKVFSIDYVSSIYEEIKLDTCDNYTLDVSDVKPYLFPLSSMTEEQKKEYRKVCELDTEILSKHPMDGTPFPVLYNSQDWCNKNHFDYRNLINKNLAIDCTNLNIY